ncbi:MAG: hypothetical protein ABI367_13160 [Mucilaginibacter sp.]
MDLVINYWWVGLLAVAIIALLIWITRRDQQDKKEFEQEIIQSDLLPEKHDDERDKEVKP